MLTRDIAHEIVNETIKRLGRNINIMDENGIILSSGERNRINTYHEGALRVIECGEPLVVDETDALIGTKPGVNLPITFHGEVIGVVGISGPPEEVTEFGSLVVMMTELMVQQMYLMNEVEWQTRTREYLLEELISRSPDHQKVRQKCHFLDMDFQPPYKLVVFKLKLPEDAFIFPKNVYEDIHRLMAGVKGLYGFIDPETFVLILYGNGATQETRIVGQLKNIFSSHFNICQIGHTDEVTVMDALHGIYSEVTDAIRLSSKEEVSVRSMTGELLVDKLEPTKKTDFVTSVLKGVEGELKETLVVFLENDLNVSRTAKKCFIHRNTLIYRLDKIQQNTGYDPRHFKDAVVLQMACWLSISENAQNSS